MSKLRRPFLFDRYFFITVRLLKRRRQLAEGDFQRLALAIHRARLSHRFLLAAWVLLPDHFHLICAPHHPLSVSTVMKSIKIGSMKLINRRRHASGELWQDRFFDRALRTVKEYNEKVEYLHLNPVRAGLVIRAADWKWSSVLEYSGVSAEEQERRCGLAIDRLTPPADPRTRI